ncbi:MAG: formate transporter [Eubacteriales bacterium]|nr:formate transporter [Eubacteriales bacterium]
MPNFAPGSEHSIANTYFIPFAITIKAHPAVQEAWLLKGSGGDLGGLNWGNFIVNNLVLVAIGNIIGGAVFVGLASRFICLYKRV